MSPNNSPWIVDVSEDDFDAQVLLQSRDRPVVVDFWAPWCGPCRMLGPLLEKLVGERNGTIALAKINTDANQRLAMEFQIDAIPRVVAFRDGRPVAEFVGLLSEGQLRQFLDQILPGAAEKLAHEAAGLEATDPVRAESLYRQALEKNPCLDVAIVGLARVLVAQNKDAEAADLLANSAVGGEWAEEVERLQGLLALREAAREFGDEATARQRLAVGPDNAQLRYELGSILAAQGKYPEALAMLLSAGERDLGLATSRVRPSMVQIFHIIGNQSPLANDYRQRLSTLLY